MPHKDPEKRKAYAKAWREQHKAETKAYNKQYREENKETLAAQKQEYAAEHSDAIAQYQAEYRESHRTEKAQYGRDYYREHRDNLLSKQQQYDADHAAERRAYGIQYVQAHKGELIQYHHHYNRDRQVELLTRVLSHYGRDGKAVCVRCGFSSDIHGLTIDHIEGHGNKHRRNLGGSHFYEWLEREGYPTGYQTMCGSCQLVKRHENNETNHRNAAPSASALGQARLREQRRRDVISHYSHGTMACAKCGNAEYHGLTIDHIAGNGAEHRRAEKVGSGATFYSWLIKNNFPPGYQCLCMTCQLIKRWHNHETRH